MCTAVLAVWWSLSETATYGGAVMIDLYREVAALQRYCRLQCVSAVLGCFREMATFYSDHTRQVSLYHTQV